MQKLYTQTKLGRSLCKINIFDSWKKTLFLSYVYKGLSGIYAWIPHEGQKRAMKLLELALQMAVSCHVGARNLT